MPTHAKQPASSANADLRLSQLLKLKRLEKPGAEFWRKFEQDFKSRQLTTFVQIQPLRTRLRKACLLGARKAAPPVAALGAIVLTFFAANHPAFLADSSKEIQRPVVPPAAPHAETAQAEESYFVVNDALEPSVKESPPLSDTIYKVNSLSSRNKQPQGYQLNVSPVTYSSKRDTQEFGARIISVQARY